MIDTGENGRARAVRRGELLEYATIAYNSLEGLIGIGAGLLAGSVALVGFGFDSAIEVTSGAVLLWRLRADLDPARPPSARRSGAGRPPAASTSRRSAFGSLGCACYTSGTIRFERSSWVKRPSGVCPASCLPSPLS